MPSISLEIKPLTANFTEKIGHLPLTMVKNRLPDIKTYQQRFGRLGQAFHGEVKLLIAFLIDSRGQITVSKVKNRRPGVKTHQQSV